MSGALDSLLSAFGEGAARPGEPAWLRQVRAEALARFGQNPPLDSRYTRLRLPWRTLPSAEPRFDGAAAPSPELSPVSPGGPSGPARDLGQWIADREALYRQMVDRAIPFDRLVLGGWTSGMAFEWPLPGAPEGIPIVQAEPAEGLVLEPYLLDVAGGARADLFLSWKGGASRALRLSTIAGRVGEGSVLRLVLLHEGGGEHHHLSLDLDLGPGAAVEIFGCWLGGGWTVYRGKAGMLQPGSSWKESHMSWGSSRDHLDIETTVLHGAPRTRSDVQAKAALAGAARSVFAGNILMEKEAVQGDAYLSDHVLLLSRDARSDSIPGLVIRSMDLKAAHAASTGQVDEEALFYLESRGLDPAQARHVLVKGFLSSLLDRAPFPFLQEIVDPLLEVKVLA